MVAGHTCHQHEMLPVCTCRIIKTLHCWWLINHVQLIIVTDCKYITKSYSFFSSTRNAPETVFSRSSQSCIESVSRHLLLLPLHTTLYCLFSLTFRDNLISHVLHPEVQDDFTYTCKQVSRKEENFFPCSYCENNCKTTIL